jgi:hypothetical protein
MIDKGMTGYAIAKKTGRSESHISSIRRRYNKQKKEDGVTSLLQDVNKRLAMLLDLRPRPKAESPTEGGDRLAA